MLTQNTNPTTPVGSGDYFDVQLTKAQSLRNLGSMFWPWVTVLASWGVVGLFVMSFELSYK